APSPAPAPSRTPHARRASRPPTPTVDPSTGTARCPPTASLLPAADAPQTTAPPSRRHPTRVGPPANIAAPEPHRSPPQPPPIRPALPAPSPNPPQIHGSAERPAPQAAPRCHPIHAVARPPRAFARRPTDIRLPSPSTRHPDQARDTPALSLPRAL